MAKVWSTLYDAVLPHLSGLTPGAPADFLIKRAAIEFFDRSCAWRVAIPAFQATADTGAYTLAAPVATTTVVKVTELRYLGKPLEHKTPGWLAEHYDTEDWRAKTGTPLYWTEEAPNEVTIVPKPTVTTAAALAGWCAVKPLDDASGIQTDAMWREHHDTIARLAVARGMLSPKKPYTDKAEGRQMLKDLEGEIGLIGYHISTGGGGVHRTRTHWI